MSLDADFKKSLAEKLTQEELDRIEEHGDLIEAFAFQWTALSFYSDQEVNVYCQRFMKGVLDGKKARSK